MTALNGGSWMLDALLSLDMDDIHVDTLVSNYPDMSISEQRQMLRFLVIRFKRGEQDKKDQIKALRWPLAGRLGNLLTAFLALPIGPPAGMGY